MDFGVEIDHQHIIQQMVPPVFQLLELKLVQYRTGLAVKPQEDDALARAPGCALWHITLVVEIAHAYLHQSPTEDLIQRVAVLDHIGGGGGGDHKNKDNQGDHLAVYMPEPQPHGHDHQRELANLCQIDRRQ
jgi:hypothetical protein